jgi:hypothetical protein
MSLARSCFELANVGLEDVIIAEINGGKMDGGQVLSNLALSIKHLGDMKAHIANLRAKMVEQHFKDLPPLRTIDFTRLGTALVENDIVDALSWREVTRIASSGGFALVLCQIESLVDLLAGDSVVLEMRTTELFRKNKMICPVLEENRKNNIKVVFAQVYTQWAKLQMFFLASAMSSTEQWYVFMGYQPLLGDKPMLLEPAEAEEAHT